MSLHDARAILKRLLVTTHRCRDAFIEAAFAVVPEPLTVFFVRRAQHQQRIAEYLTRRLESEGAPHLTLLPALPLDAARARRVRPRARPRVRDPLPLLDASIRALDTSILEFYRAVGPATPRERQLSLERHHDWMRWSREELLSMQRMHRPRHLRLLVDVEGEEARMLDDTIWLEEIPDTSDRDAWFAELIPLEGAVARD